VAIETIVVPDLGGAESVDVIELSLAQGDTVGVEDSLLVLESDKATMDVPSPHEGQLVKYLVAEGDTVKVGDPIAELEIQADTSQEVSNEAAESLDAEVEDASEATVAPEAAPAAKIEEKMTEFDVAISSSAVDLPLVDSESGGLSLMSLYLLPRLIYLLLIQRVGMIFMQDLRSECWLEN